MKSKNKKLISLAVFCFNEEATIPHLYPIFAHFAKTHPRYDFEFVFADNGSTDDTPLLIKQLAKKDKRVTGAILSRNFGPEASQQACMDLARGDAIIPYECDMQDPIEIVDQFIKKWEEGFDIVVGIRNKIEDNLIMTFIRTTYYKMFKIISDIDIPVNAGTFCLMSRRVLNTISALPENYRFYRGLRAWVGFSTAYVQYARRRRKYGKSSYNLARYLRHAERSFFGFSYLQLDVIIYLGFLFFTSSFVFLLFYLAYVFFSHTTISNLVVLLLVSIFLGGIQLLAISVVGKYIQVIVEETKHRPLYIVDTYVNLSKYAPRSLPKTTTQDKMARNGG